MAARNLGSIPIKGSVVIEWDNGSRTVVGEVSTYVEIKLDDEEPVTLSKSWNQEGS
ncbi:hypothetical protein ACTJKO_07740 [Curtobacterium sp. 22159]|uniref:hypothetical protein n=1 Tax=Curtobacterium sp. 22159 TaxID=3453882 RepID=UPI003F83F006